MATIVAREGADGKVRWQCKVRLGGKNVSKTFAKKSDAQVWARAQEGLIDRREFDQFAELNKTTLLELINRYLKEITPEKRGEKQERLRLEAWKKVEFVSRPLSQIKPEDLSKWIRDRQRQAMAKKDGEGKPLSSATLNHDLMTLSGVYKTAMTLWSMTGLTNPVRSIKVPPLGDARERRLEGDEEQRLLAAIEASDLDNWLAPAFVIAIETALRQGRVAELKRGDLDLDKRIITLERIVKGKPVPVKIPLTRKGAAVLKDYLDANPLEPDDKLIQMRGNFQNAWRRVCGAAKVEDLTWHDLRHEAVSRLFEKGLAVIEVKAITGHKTLSMLVRYANLKAENLVERIDQLEDEAAAKAKAKQEKAAEEDSSDIEEVRAALKAAGKTADEVETILERMLQAQPRRD